MPEPLADYVLPHGTEVVVFGGGGHARAIVDVLARVDVAVAATVAPDLPSALADDAAGIDHALAHGLPAVLAVGDNTRRRDLAARLADAGVALPPVIAWTATVASDAHLGAGTIVMEHAHVGAGCRVGTACLVNTGAIVEHDCLLRGGVHCGPRSVLTGSVRCGRRAFLGAGAVVLPGTEIGEDAVVGAGCVVIADVAPGQTVMGVPGRPATQRSGA